MSIWTLYAQIGFPGRNAVPRKKLFPSTVNSIPFSLSLESPENKFGKPTTDQLDFRHVYQSNEVLLESQWDLGLISTLPEVRLQIPVFAL